PSSAGDPVMVASTQLECTDRENRAQYADDPEAHHHLGFGPTLQLEVVVQRRSKKNTVLLRKLQPVLLSSVLEHIALNDDRQGFCHKYAANDDKQEFTLEQHRDGTEGAAQRE